MLQLYRNNKNIFRLIGDLPNTYSFTKSLAEDAIRREAQDLPILVLRPTIGMYLLSSILLLVSPNNILTQDNCIIGYFIF